MTYSETDKYYYAFCRSEVIGPVNFGRLLKIYESPKFAWEASSRELREVGLTERMVEGIERVKRKVDLESELEELATRDVRLLKLGDEDYPENLAHISDPPYLLFVRGEIKTSDQKAVAVVGSRKMSRYGKEAIGRIVPALVDAGFTIVSGLALGVDTESHRKTLESEGRTLAVLGSGIYNISPMSTRKVGLQIIEDESGAILSEFHPFMDPKPYNFPVRNRIISGLSLGVLIVEGTIKSGTMSTASHALGQGKEVFAVPGDIISAQSKGPNKLIKEGAKLTESAEDILEEFGLDSASAAPAKGADVEPGSPEEKALLDVLAPGKLHIDEIVRTAGLDSSQVLSTLSIMELKGLVVDMGGGMYKRSF